MDKAVSCSLVCWNGIGLGGLQADIRKKIKRWMDNQHMAIWWFVNSTQGEDRILALRPSTTAKNRLLSFNRTKCRVFTGLLTGHNTLKRHLFIFGLIVPHVGRL